MSWLDFLVLTLAASAVVDVWANGSIFADWRAFLQDKADEPPPVQAATDDSDDVIGEPMPILMRVVDRVLPRFGAELLSCMFCFSHHTPYILALLFYLPALFVDSAWGVFLLKLPVYSLAATRLGNLLDAYAPEGAKYYRD